MLVPEDEALRFRADGLSAHGSDVLSLLARMETQETLELAGSVHRRRPQRACRCRADCFTERRTTNIYRQRF
jgi:hypothetical protein